MIFVIICHQPLEIPGLEMGVGKEKALYFVGAYSMLQI